MADWLLSIQFANGAFQGGLVDSTPRVPVVFNTGQILIGLSAAAEKFAGDYHGSMMRAAHWLCDVQDPSGGWSTHCSPFARPGSKTFDTHASIGLLSAARVSGESRFAEAALRNLRWATSHATRNGFIRSCCLDTPRAPYTHTLGYYLRGVVEGAYHFQDDSLLQSALLTARALQRCVEADGRLPGRLTHRLRPGAPWVCLTGSAQIAHSFFLLSKHDSSL
ncbi:MAG: hypothetical protein IT290_04035, partial [Deltaproteobacteria bacterium]|nr:hypothetical protein [Deltaproteobacteria bacterium]